MSLWLQTEVCSLRWATQRRDEEGASAYSGATEEAEEKPRERQNQGTSREEGKEGQRETRPQGKSKPARFTTILLSFPFIHQRIDIYLNYSFGMKCLSSHSVGRLFFAMFLNVCLFSLAKVWSLWSHRTHEDQQVLPAILSDQRPTF